jgi:hypothetical protein
VALEAYASVQDYADFWCLGPEEELTDSMVDTIEHMLLLSSSQLHMARASVGVASGALSEEARLLFRYLNCMIAAVINNCPCGSARLDDDQKKVWLYEIAQSLAMIRSGDLPLTDYETGSQFPYADYAQINYNDFTTVGLLARSLMIGG